MGSELLGLLIYLAGLFLLFLELFVPGGILGVIGSLCTLYGIWSIISWNTWAGVAVIAATAVYIYLLIKFWAKRVTMVGSLGDAVGSSQDASPHEVVGEEGVADSRLCPTGYARIGKRRLQVVANSGYVEKGAKVRVIEVSGNRVVVAPVRQPRRQGEDLEAL